MVGADLVQLPVIESDQDDADVQSLSSDDDDQINNDFAFDLAFGSESSSKAAKRRALQIPDQGVTTMKPSIASRKIQTEIVPVEDNDQCLVEIQSKHVGKKPEAETVVSSSSGGQLKDFSCLGLSRILLVNLSRMGIYQPTAVQEKSIPCVLQGQDLLVNAVTGSGKTCAFMLPILERLLQCPNRLSLSRVLILSPTRELADQCFQVTQQLCQGTSLRVCLVVGGFSVQKQVAALQTRPDIVIATPGRLIDHIRNSQSIHLDTIEILVLDEADRLLELGFVDEVQECINFCPKGRQTMLFSATLTSQVASLADLSLSDPRRISISAVHALPTNLSQEFVRIRDNSSKRSMAVLLALCKRTVKTKTIIFFPSRVLAHRAFHIFGLAGLKAAELHGDLTQLQRLDALEQFRSCSVDFLLCTDLASRGLDIADVQNVINFSFPSQLATYVHRVGRTARANKSGHAITLVTDHARPLLKEIIKNSSSTVKSRKISSAVIDSFLDLIESMTDKIKEIEGEEKIEKEIRVAEMNANKMQNMLSFEHEIMNRPKKTWFCSVADKKKASASVSDPLKSKNSSKEAVAESKKPLKEQLRGLSRKQKRRKLQAFEDQKDAEERSGPSAETIMSIASRKEKTKRRVTRDQLNEGSLLKQKQALKRKYQDDDAETKNPFAERYKDDDEDKQDNQTERKRKNSKRKGSFHSKTRFKRRK